MRATSNARSPRRPRLWRAARGVLCRERGRLFTGECRWRTRRHLRHLRPDSGHRALRCERLLRNLRAQALRVMGPYPRARRNRSRARPHARQPLRAHSAKWEDPGRDRSRRPKAMRPAAPRSTTRPCALGREEERISKLRVSLSRSSGCFSFCRRRARLNDSPSLYASQ